jgi:acyl carrier protein
MSDDSASTLTRFAGLIANVAPKPVQPEAITPRASLTEDLALDSISLVALLALAEEAFGVAFAEHSQQVAGIQTVGDAIDLIDSLVATSTNGHRQWEKI